VIDTSFMALVYAAMCW